MLVLVLVVDSAGFRTLKEPAFPATILFGYCLICFSDPSFARRGAPIPPVSWVLPPPLHIVLDRRSGHHPNGLEKAENQCAPVEKFEALCQMATVRLAEEISQN